MSTQATPITPVNIDAMDAAFSSNVSRLMPRMADIPDEFKQHPGTDWNRLQAKWFFVGLDARVFRAKEGIDRKMALRNLQAIQGSFEPQHEHKEAAVAYLMSLWFEPLSEKELKAALAR